MTTPVATGDLTWMDPAEPAVRAAVVSGAWGRSPHSEHAPIPPADPNAIDPIADALRMASENLSRLTGFVVHPAGSADEEFVATAQIAKMTLQMTPVRTVRKVRIRNAAGNLVDYSGAWWRFQHSVHFHNPAAGAHPLISGPWITSSGLVCGDGQTAKYFVVTYDFGSTITASARAAVFALAHEYWLAIDRCDSCEECSLPDNVINVVREGITYSMDNLADTSTWDRTGIPGVDRWVNRINPHGVRARSGIYDPSNPPGVIRRVVGARPTWEV